MYPTAVPMPGAIAVPMAVPAYLPPKPAPTSTPIPVAICPKPTSCFGRASLLKNSFTALVISSLVAPSSVSYSRTLPSVKVPSAILIIIHLHT